MIWTIEPDESNLWETSFPSNVYISRGYLDAGYFENDFDWVDLEKGSEVWQSL
jgi:hypothetical protein